MTEHNGTDGTSRRDESNWVADFNRQHERGRQILVYGNVSDMFKYQGEAGFLSLPALLDRYFGDHDYSIVAHYDIVDGFTFVTSEMANRWDRLIVEADGGSFTERPAEQTEAGRYRARGNELPPNVALATVRRQLLQAAEPLVVIVEFTDMLVDNSVQNDKERQLLVQIKKIARDLAEFNRTGPSAGDDTGPTENRLVVVASHLAAVPRWLYLDEPLFGLVEIAKPSQAERRRYIAKTGDGFRGVPGMDSDQRKGLFETLATLTDGFTLLDIDALHRTSHGREVGRMAPRRLIDYFKYGESEDPWESLNRTRVQQAPKFLQQRVIGQPAAITAVVDMLISGRVGIDFSTDRSKLGRPKGAFFFVGPTGVGKTELAKALTELIFQDEEAFARFDMSEYAQEHAAEKLVGAPPGFVGYDEGGQLTRRLKERPFSVLLFDEIEKAHPRVLDKFLQILEDGRLTDGKGETVYFSQAVVIFTSNVGSPGANEGGFDWSHPPEYPELREHYIRATSDYFTNILGRPELLSRLGDNILVFDMIRPDYVRLICRKFQSMLAEAAQERSGIDLRFVDDSVVDWVAGEMKLEHNLRMGGRRIRALLDGAVRHPLNRWLFFQDPPRAAETVVEMQIAVDGGLIVQGEPVAGVTL